MKIVGFALVALGILVLVFAGLGYDRERTVLDVGPIQATAIQHHSVPVPPIVGVLAIVSGLVLLITPRRRPSEEPNRRRGVLGAIPSRRSGRGGT